MFTVAILINGNPLMARSAVNQCEQDADGRTKYRIDTGEVILHDPKDGAIALAHKLLDTLHEQRA